MNDVPFYEYQGNGHRIPKDVKRVRFHPSVTKIDDEAFNYCKRLRQVVFNEGLQTIGGRAFYGCKSLQSITLPSTVTEIGLCAFQSCGELRKVVLNEGLEKIDQYAFYGCSSLESITIPSTVTDIEEGAFYRCSGLKNVVLNEGLKKIGRGSFDGCISLESITLPSSVEEIGDYGFLGCINLREVVCIEGLPAIGPSTFSGCSALERFTFPNISSRLDAIIQAGLVDLQNKVQQYVNHGDIECRGGGTIYIPVEVTRRTRTRDEWGIVQQHFRQIANWIKYYEIKEGTTIFELALWKAKMDQQVEEDACARDRKKAKMNQAGDTNRRDDRNVYRVDVPGPVKDTILQYL